MPSRDLRYAPAQTVWVCNACGRTGKDRYQMGDTSCMTWAVLCWNEPDEKGVFHAVPEDSLPSPDTG